MVGAWDIEQKTVKLNIYVIKFQSISSSRRKKQSVHKKSKIWEKWEQKNDTLRMVNNGDRNKIKMAEVSP